MNVRAATPEDAAAVAALAAENEEVLTGRPSLVAANDVAGWWSRAELSQDSWLFEEDGRLAAAGWADRVGDLACVLGIVGQGWKGRGLGSELVDRGEAAAARLGAARVHAVALAADAAAAALFTRRNYRDVRRFYEMAIELDEPPPAPEVPPALSVEPVDPEEAHVFWQALEESFADHWEHHPVPFEQWWDQKRAAPDFDRTLWFVVRDGDELVAAVRNDPDRNGGGHVAALGVRRRWRGRGLGRALLHRTFGEFWARGITRVTLGVDAQNPTGATKLYESVGMEVELESVVFEKALA